MPRRVISSGGGYYTPLNAEDIPRALAQRTITASRVVEKDILDSPMFFLVFCGVVCTEWMVRRRKNLI